MRMFNPIERTFKSNEFAVSLISLPDSSARAFGVKASNEAKPTTTTAKKRRRVR
jgi:hypothetical protein